MAVLPGRGTRVQMNGFAVNMERDYIDATAFGDTTRRYLVAPNAFDGLRKQLSAKEPAMPSPGEVLTWIRTGESPKARRRRRTQEERDQLVNNFRAYQADIDRLNEEMRALMRTLGEQLIEQQNLQRVTPDNLPAFVKQELSELERVEADERASWLLDQYLTDEQRKMFAKHKKFLVKGKSNTYRLHQNGTVGVVDEKGKELGQFCVYPQSTALPTADAILAYKLMLEASEKEFLKIANYTGYAPADGPAPVGPDRQARAHASLGKLKIDGKMTGAEPRAGRYVTYDWFLDTNNIQFTLTNNTAGAPVFVPELDTVIDDAVTITNRVADNIPF